MNRNIENTLLQWKDDPDRKVLLVRGARQVGKTYSIRQMGAGFKHFLEVNFEEEPAIKKFFADSLNPEGICQKLSGYFGVPIITSETLLFLDEIQACPEALKSLRFFHEKAPELHVVAAGSLLEFAMDDLESFGVGRITSLFMYPLIFTEFLSVIQGEGLTDILLGCQLDQELDEPFHRKLLDTLRTYWLVGGMPAAVEAFRKHRDLRRCQENLDTLITSIQDDFGKYKEKANIPSLRDVFYSIPQQTGNKFKYANISPDNKTYHYKIALDLLVRAGLAHRIHHTSARGIPLNAQLTRKRFKVLSWDVGVYQRMLGLDLSELLVTDDIDLVNKGDLAELFVGLELITSISPYIKPELHYWHREARASNAEVDYIIQKGTHIIPIEVKAGTRGQMQSMKLFQSERGLDRGVCFSSQNFSHRHGIHFVPIYAAGCLRNML